MNRSLNGRADNHDTGPDEDSQPPTQLVPEDSCDRTSDEAANLIQCNDGAQQAATWIAYGIEETGLGDEAP